MDQYFVSYVNTALMGLPVIVYYCNVCFFTLLGLILIRPSSWLRAATAPWDRLFTRH